MTTDERALRWRIIDTAVQLAGSGLTHGTSGNVSARWQDGFLVTPTGMDYDHLSVDDVVFIDAAGVPAPGARSPSSEWRMHHDIYRARPEAGAIVHAHPPHATALACTRRGIPAFHYEVAIAGGADIRCAPYETYGTQALSDAAVAALEGRSACLLANHGMLALAADTTAALKLAGLVEALAHQYLLTLAIGGPVLLSEPQFADVEGKIRNYGKQDPH